MGNEQPKNLQIRDDYSFYKEINDFVYGQAKVFRDYKVDRYYALKSFTFNNQNEYKKTTKFIQEVYENQTQRDIKILEIQKMEFDKIFLTIEYHQKSLEQEYEERQKNRSSFLESEIIDVLLTVLQSIKNQPYNDNIQLSLSKILVAENGMKFGNLKLMLQMQDYQRLLMGAIPEKDLLLSPEALNGIGKRFYKQRSDLLASNRVGFDKEKSRIFSLGILSIQLCSLQDPHEMDVYDLEKSKINPQELNQYYIQAEKQDQYSGELCGIIKQMIEIDPQKRPNQDELIKQLQKIPQKRVQPSLIPVSTSRIRSKWRVPPLDKFENNNKDKNNIGGSLWNSRIKRSVFNSSQKEVKEIKDIYQSLQQSRLSQDRSLVINQNQQQNSESKGLIMKMEQALQESQRIVERYQKESQKGLNYYSENKITVPCWRQQKKKHINRNERYK